MSWWVDLSDENGIVQVDRHSEGGTYALGGTPQADLNITYNYSEHYYKHLNEEEGLQWLHGKRAKDTIAALESAVNKLGTKTSSDYWKPTKGNAGYALSILLSWARQYPEAVWDVS